MKPEAEVKTSLNVLYHAVFSGGTDQLVVKQASEDSYLIVLGQNRQSSGFLENWLINGFLVELKIDRKDGLGPNPLPYPDSLKGKIWQK